MADEAPVAPEQSSEVALPEPVAPPAVNSESYLPAVIYVDLSPELSVIAVENLAWFHATTGIPAIPVVIGPCETGDCIEYSDRDRTRSEIRLSDDGVYSWHTEINDAGRIASEWSKVFRHEYAHLWMYPSPGFDGDGHSQTHSLMNPDLLGVWCNGFTQAEIEGMCSHRDCTEPVAECE
jgi:hypothetical protein